MPVPGGHPWFPLSGCLARAYSRVLLYFVWFTWLLMASYQALAFAVN